MKSYIPYSLILAAAASGLAFGATAYTTPVGYVSVTTPADSDTTIAACLNRATELQTTVIGATGSTLTIKAPGIAADAFVYASPAQPKTYYVKVLSGASVGEYQTIVSNLASNDNGTAGDTADDFVVLTLEAPLACAVSDSILVAPHWTLNTLFPSGAGVGTTPDPSAPTAFVIRQNQVDVDINRAPNKLYFYFADPETTFSGWYDNDDLGAGVQDDQVIYPDEFYLIRNSTGAPVTATISGEVPKVAPKTTLVVGTQENDNYVSVPVPVDMTLVESGLLESGAYTPTADPSAPIDYVLVYNNTATGINKPAFKVYFYFADPEVTFSGWYDNDDLGAGPQDAVKLLTAGNGFVVRKAAGVAGSISWSAPLPYNLSL